MMPNEGTHGYNENDDGNANANANGGQQMANFDGRQQAFNQAREASQHSSATGQARAFAGTVQNVQYVAEDSADFHSPEGGQAQSQHHATSQFSVDGSKQSIAQRMIANRRRMATTTVNGVARTGSSMVKSELRNLNLGGGDR